MIEPMMWVHITQTPINTSNNNIESDMSTQNILSVEQAKKQLKQARLHEHRERIRKALSSSNDAELAKACSRFFASFTNKGKKVKK